MDCDFNPQLQPKEIILKEEALDLSGNTIYENVLDENGMIQWTNELDGSGTRRQKQRLRIKYFDTNKPKIFNVYEKSKN